MPSGPKRRKAAKRKMEMVSHLQPDSPTHMTTATATAATPHVHEGNGTSHHEGGKDRDSGSDHHLTEEDEEVGRDKESSSVKMEYAENGGGGGENKPDETASPSWEVPVSMREEEDVRIEHVEGEKGDGGGGENKPDETASPSWEVPVSMGEEEDVRIEHVEGEKGDGGGVESVSETPVSEEVSVIAVTQVNAVNEEVTEAIESQAAVEFPPYEGAERAVVPPAEMVSIEQPRETEKCEVAVTSELATAPLVAHRASWWNCCGLLDVVAGSER